MRTFGWISLLVGLVIGIVSMAGCVTVTKTEAPRNVGFAPNYADDPYWSTATPRDPEKVLLTEGDLQRKYTVKGKIRVDSTGEETSISMKYLRREAAQRGIDAVIKIRVSRQSEGQVGVGNETVNYVTGQSYGYGSLTVPIVRHYIEGEAVIFDQ